MEEISLSKLRKLTGDDIKDNGCFKVTKDGEELAIVIVGAVQEMKTKIIVAAGQIDAMRGK